MLDARVQGWARSSGHTVWDAQANRVPHPASACPPHVLKQHHAPLAAASPVCVQLPAQHFFFNNVDASLFSSARVITCSASLFLWHIYSARAPPSLDPPPSPRGIPNREPRVRVSMTGPGRFTRRKKRVKVRSVCRVSCTDFFDGPTFFFLLAGGAGGGQKRSGLACSAEVKRTLCGSLCGGSIRCFLGGTGVIKQNSIARFARE